MTNVDDGTSGYRQDVSDAGTCTEVGISIHLTNGRDSKDIGCVGNIHPLETVSTNSCVNLPYPNFSLSFSHGVEEIRAMVRMKIAANDGVVNDPYADLLTETLQFLLPLNKRVLVSLGI